MSENGPREGTRDLPKAAMATGGRSVEPDSLSGVAYGSLGRSLRRRRSELVALLDEAGDFAAVAAAYQTKHPLEPNVSRTELEAALAEAKSRPSKSTRGQHRDAGPRTHRARA